MVGVGWRCSECGIGRAGAMRRRVRLGLRRLSHSAVVCTPVCARERERRLLRDRYGPASAYGKMHAERWKGRARPEGPSLSPQRPKRPQPETAPRQLRAWACSECGRTLAEVYVSRVSRGLEPPSLYDPTCSPACAAARFRRFQKEARGRGFELKAGEWHCLECGATIDEAQAKGGRKLSTRAVTCSPACYAERSRRKQAALMRRPEAKASTRVRRRRLRRERRRATRSGPRPRRR